MPQVTLVLVQTPHFICDARLDGVYGAALSHNNISRTIDLCAAHLSSVTALSKTQAWDLCHDGAFTGSNTAKLATRITTLVKKYFSCHHTSTNVSPLSSTEPSTADPTDTAAVCVLDAHHLTVSLPNCSEATKDGRQYIGHVLQDEVSELRRFLTRLQSTRHL